jgi:hypothetical protein
LVVGLAIALLLAGPAVAATDSEPIEITGEIEGLFPGGEATLQTEVANPHPFPIEVTVYDVVIGDASPSCPASVLDIGPATTGVVIPAGETGVVPVPVQMSETAPESCQGAIWPLTYLATAVEVGPGGGGPVPTSPEGPFEDLPLTGAAIGGMLMGGLALLLIGSLMVRQGRSGRDDEGIR